MKKIRHTLKIKNINEVQLIDLTTHAWLDNQGNQVPWVSGSLDFSPSTGSIVFNTTGSQQKGYYQYNGNTWTLVTGSNYNNMNFDDYQLPIFLDSTVDEYGPMVGFDGDIANEVKMVSANFAYSTECRILTITNNTDYDSFRNRNDLSFTIYWDDGTSEPIGIYETKTKTYPSGPTIRNVLIVASTPFGDYQTVRTIDCNCEGPEKWRILQEDHLLDGVTRSDIKTENDDYLAPEH